MGTSNSENAVPARARRSARESQLGWDEGAPEFVKGPPEPVAPQAPPVTRQARERYPMLFEVAYPRHLNRLSTAIRVALLVPLIPAWLVMQLLIGAAMLTGWVAVVATRSYPRWLYAALSEAFAFSARIETYATLLTDRFPSFNGTGSATVLAWADPPEGKLSRWRVALWKGVILIPQFAAVIFLLAVQCLASIVAWFAIVISGRFPEGLFMLSAGIHRWRYRVLGYFASFNDRFPPFALEPRAQPAKSRTVLTSGVVGFLVLGAVTGLVGAARTMDSPRAQDVSYDTLRSNSITASTGWSFASGNRESPNFIVRLVSAEDPDEPANAALQLGNESRSLTFVVQYYNGTPVGRRISVDSATLTVIDRFDVGTGVKPSVATVNGVGAPTELAPGQQVLVRFTFIIPSRSSVSELRIDPPWRSRDVAFRFR